MLPNLTWKRLYATIAALLASAVVTAGGSAAPPAHIVSLKIGDRFDIVGTHIKCRVGASGSAHRTPAVTCSIERPGTNAPLAKSYTFSFGDHGVDVLGPGAKGSVVFDFARSRGGSRA